MPRATPASSQSGRKEIVPRGLQVLKAAISKTHHRRRKYLGVVVVDVGRQPAPHKVK